MTVLPGHGGQLRALATQFGVDAAGLLDFSASISPYPPPSGVLDRIGRAACDPELLRVYPDSESLDLRDAVAEYVNAPAPCIAVGNGVMPLISAALQALTIRRCMVVTPSFRGYEEALRIAGVECVDSALRADADFFWTPELLVNAAVRLGCHALLLANPHSPSGVVAERERVLALCELAAADGIAVLLDEAFVDYVPDCSVSSYAAAGSAMIVFRSPTKFFAIPAFRVAYAVASSELAGRIRSFVHEWPVSSVASLACAELLRCSEHHAFVREQNELERNWMRKALGGAGIRVFPSRANFFLMRVASAEKGLRLWRSLIETHGIVVRSCGNFSGLDTSYLRFGLRERDENARLLDALRLQLAAI